jgi:hypothetical protein
VVGPAPAAAVVCDCLDGARIIFNVNNPTDWRRKKTTSHGHRPAWQIITEKNHGSNISVSRGLLES